MFHGGQGLRSGFYFVGCFLSLEYYKSWNEGQDIPSKSVFWRLDCNFILIQKKIGVENTDRRETKKTKPFSGEGLFTWFFLHLKFSVCMGV